MGEPRYWYLAQGPEDDPEEKMNVLSAPWWHEVVRHNDGEGAEGPMLFTTRGAAEGKRRELRYEPDDYLEAVNALGEGLANEAFDNALPYRVYSLPAEWMLLKLEDATFGLLFVDGVPKERTDLLEELSRG